MGDEVDALDIAGLAGVDAAQASGEIFSGKRRERMEG